MIQGHTSLIHVVDLGWAISQVVVLQGTLKKIKVLFYYCLVGRLYPYLSSCVSMPQSQLRLSLPKPTISNNS